MKRNQVLLALLVLFTGFSSRAIEHEYYFSQAALSMGPVYSFNEPFLGGFGGTNANDFTYISSRTIAGFRIHDAVGLPYYTAYSITITADIWKTDQNNGTPALIPSMVFILNYDPAGGTTYKAVESFILDATHKVQVEILSIATSGVSNTTVPENIQFFTVMKYNRYLESNCSLSAISQSVSIPGSHFGDKRYAELQWYSQAEAEYYDLEYTWVFDASEQYNFSRNSTRIRIPDSLARSGVLLTYRLPLVFEAGWVVWRMRAVCYDSYGGDRAKYYSGFNLANSGTVSGVSSTYKFSTGSTSEHEPNINWQHSAVFAENGVRMDQVSYADGTSRVRQTLSSNNIHPMFYNDGESILVSETYYDCFGRAAVSALPAPDYPATGEVNRAFYYREGFNLNENEDPYSYADFQLDDTKGCGALAQPMDNSSGAAMYYSDQNPGISGSYSLDNFLPDAQSYPFVQKVFTPDQTGRVQEIGAAGGDLGVGGAHSTRYYYGVPSQAELDILFGNHIGNKEFYRKQMTRDPNGQVAVSYTNLSGQVVATALAGAQPSNLEALPSHGDNNSSLTVNLMPQLGGASWDDMLDGDLTTVMSILVEAAGTNHFSYHFYYQVYDLNCPDEDPVCEQCHYEAKLILQDNCGNIIDEDYGHFPPNPSECFADRANMDIEPSLEVGNYTLTKILKVDTDRLMEHAASVAECKRDSVYDYYLDLYTTEIDDPCNGTESACEEFQELVFIEDEYDTPAIYTAQMDYLVCDYADPCYAAKQMMISNLMPGGQYGLLGSLADAYSFYDPLGTPQLATLWDDSGLDYKNADGSPAYVYVTKQIDGSYLPEVKSSATPVHVGGLNYRILPQELEHVADFILLVNREWIASILHMVHPEYECYIDCIESYRTVTLFSAYLNSLSFAEAISEGFVNGSTLHHSFPSSFITALCTLNLSTALSDFQSSGFGISLIAYYLTNQTYYETPENWPPKDALSFEDCNEEVYWQYLRSFYITALAQAWEDCWNEHLEGATECEVDGSKESVFVSAWDAFDETFPSQDSLDAYDGMYELCEARCEARVERWMSMLEDCYSGGSQGTGSQWALLMAELLDLCNSYCDLDDLPAYTAGTIFLQNLISDYNQFDLGCAQEIIARVYPTNGYNPMTELNFLPPDTCTCNIVDEIDQAWSAITPSGDPMEFHLFVAQYGLGVELYEELKCRCEEAGSPGAWDLEKFEDVFELCTIQLPPALRCQSCMVCGEWDTLFGQFVSAFPTADTMLLIELMTPHINHLHASQWSAVELYNYFRACYEPRECYSECAFDFNALRENLDQIFAAEDCFDFFILYRTDDYFFQTIMNELFPSMGYKNGLILFSPYKIGSNWYIDIIFYTQIDDLEPLEICRFSFYINTEGYDIDLDEGICYLEFLYIVNECYLEIENCTVSLLEYGPSNNPLTNGTSTCFLDNCLVGLQWFATDSDSTLCQPVRLAVEPCENHLLALAATNAHQMTEQVLATIQQDEYLRLLETCLSNLGENLTRQYDYTLHHFTLYYYDRAGNLQQTVPPKGVVLLSSGAVTASRNYRLYGTGSAQFPAHTMASSYHYDSYNQVYESSNPDAGIQRFWYDAMGRIAVSARAQQYADDLYSYSLYDLQERVFEAGELANSPSAMTTVTSRNAFLLRYWIYEGDKQQVTRTWYDAPASITSEGYFANGQNHLRNRVAASAYFVEHQPTLTVDDAHNATFYSYDIHGNVDYYAVRIAQMGPVESQRIKTMRYRYDLLSGNVLLVEYQPTQAIDHFEQRYHYDHNNRLILAQSSRNGMLWDNEAQYHYYTHGPLARTVLGHEQVQGMDYAYTINGWLAGMNSSILYAEEMGLDGFNASIHQEIASDAYSFAIQYFDNAYEGIGATNYLTLHSFLSSTRYQALYNGNISAMTSSLIDEDEADAGAGLRLYRYDQLNRITKAYWEDVPYQWAGGNMSSNTHITNKAYSSYSYDANGNLLTLERYTLQGSPVRFDNLGYNYTTNTNRLSYVSDNGTNQGNDLPNGQTGDNYTYDQDGNLIADTQEGHSISWNVQGKVHTVAQSTGPDLQFEYGPQGHRIEKRIKNDATELRWDRYYYLRDPQGNVMAVYSFSYDDLGNDEYCRSMQLDELHVYGSSRIAVSKPQATLYKECFELTSPTFDSEGFLTGGTFLELPGGEDNTGSSYAYTITRGRKYYEISNHLGNVMSTLRDYKIPQESSGDILNFTPDVSSWQDYLPFGMLMYHRNGDDGEVGRYGWGSHERVDEISGSGNHYTAMFWEYDSRTGRRWNVDPVYKHYLSNYSVMSGNPISRVDPNGANDGWIEDETGELTWDENVNSQEDFDKSGYDKDKFSYAGQELQRAYSLGSTAGFYTQYYGSDGNTSIHDYPMWVEQGKQHIGLTEGGNATIQTMIDNMNAAFPRSDGETPISSDAEPWCGVFVYDCLTGAGQSVTQKPKTWQTPALNTFYSNNWAEGTVLTNPTYGAIAVMSYGHVAMVVGYDDTYVWILGGNQPQNGAAVRDGVEVNITKYKRSLVSKYVIPAGYDAPPLGTFDE